MTRGAVSHGQPTALIQPGAAHIIRGTTSATSGLRLPLPSQTGIFDEAFRRAGFKDARSEEVERYLQNFVQERPGVAGSQLREQEFLRILAAHDSKCRFLRTARVSSDEWVCNALRGLSHHFTKRTLQNGECLWFPWSGEPMLSIIIAGNAMLWARQGNAFSRGLVDFPIATLGANSVIGDDLMPHVASKVMIFTTTWHGACCCAAAM